MSHESSPISKPSTEMTVPAEISVNPDAVKSFMDSVDQHLDEVVPLRREPNGGKEYWKLQDGVYARERMPDGTIERHPVVVIEQGSTASGNLVRETVPTGQFLGWMEAAKFKE